MIQDLFNDTDTPGALHGKLDAILRDPNASADVRAFVNQVLALDSYTNANEFSTDENGYVSVVPRAASDVESGSVQSAPLDASAPPATADSSREAQQDAEIARLQAELDASRAAAAPDVATEEAATAPGPEGAAASPQSEAAVPDQGGEGA